MFWSECSSEGSTTHEIFSTFRWCEINYSPNGTCKESKCYLLRAVIYSSPALCLPRTLQVIHPRALQVTLPRTLRVTLPRTLQVTLPRMLQVTLPRTLQVTLPRTLGVTHTSSSTTASASTWQDFSETF